MPRVRTDGSPGSVAVLFSGGLDCTVIARLCHDLLPPSQNIDLINVAFENPRLCERSGVESSECYEMCPDRITARKSYQQLKAACPDRSFRLLAIDVPYSEVVRCHDDVVSLMHPHNTEMDLSISYALYFAARGIGRAEHKMGIEAEVFETSARVLLSGLGADELFGGYSRHAKAYCTGGLSSLIDELQLDIVRLSSRNTGRDDRVISHWNREVRYPFLDERLVAWAMDVPVHEKTGFGENHWQENTRTSKGLDGESLRLPPGKRVLRCLSWKLGMESAAVEPKRAVSLFD